MAGFRRAQLRGSDELFRPTAPEATESEESRPELETEALTSAAAPEPVVIEHELTSTTVETITAIAQAPAPAARTVAATTVADLGRPLDESPRSLKLSPEELELLAEAVQHLKFPGKSPTRPSIDDFERLEELRQKLLNAI